MLWDRKLIRALFGFTYSWEIYTPAAQRRYGYYVRPAAGGTVSDETVWIEPFGWIIF